MIITPYPDDEPTAEPPPQPDTPGTRLKKRAAQLRASIKKAAPFLGGILAALLGMALFNALNPPARPLTAEQVREEAAAVLASATPPAAYSAQVYAAIQPSLVLIEVEGVDESGHSGQGLGSGVVVTDGGDILTSLHVVEGASQIKVTFADGTESPAEITATQPENDIAVIHPLQPPPQVFPAVLGSPGSMRVGDEAFVVGNPYGLYSSMSSGVISGFGRSFEGPDGGQPLRGLIQFDTAVNPGNSGGPLLNRQGQVVGIVVGLLNPTESDFFVGIGFAVPINVAGGALGSPQY